MRCNMAMALAAATLLGGCGFSSGYSTSPPAPCPRISILADGADWIHTDTTPRKYFNLALRALGIRIRRQYDARHTYAVRAEIRDPAGALRFTTDTRHSVLTQGAPNKVDIMMVGVR